MPGINVVRERVAFNHFDTIKDLDTQLVGVGNYRRYESHRSVRAFGELAQTEQQCSCRRNNFLSSMTSTGQWKWLRILVWLQTAMSYEERWNRYARIHLGMVARPMVGNTETRAFMGEPISPSACAKLDPENYPNGAMVLRFRFARPLHIPPGATTRVDVTFDDAAAEIMSTVPGIVKVLVGGIETREPVGIFDF